MGMGEGREQTTFRFRSFINYSFFVTFKDARAAETNTARDQEGMGARLRDSFPAAPHSSSGPSPARRVLRCRAPFILVCAHYNGEGEGGKRKGK